MVASFVQNTGSILNAIASLKYLADLGMSLELLKFFVRIQVRVLIVETHDVAQVHEVWLHVIHEGASVDIARHWPVNSVHHVPCLEVRIIGGDLPDLLQTQAIMLNTCGIFVKLEATFEVLSQRATSSLRKHRLFSDNFHSGHVVVFLATVFSDSESTSDDTLDLAFTVLNNGVTGETW